MKCLKGIQYLMQTIIVIMIIPICPIGLYFLVRHFETCKPHLAIEGKKVVIRQGGANRCLNGLNFNS